MCVRQYTPKKKCNYMKALYIPVQFVNSGDQKKTKTNNQTSNKFNNKRTKRNNKHLQGLYIHAQLIYSGNKQRK